MLHFSAAAGSLGARVIREPVECRPLIDDDQHSLSPSVRLESRERSTVVASSATAHIRPG